MKRVRVATIVCIVVACVSLALAGCQAHTYTPTAPEQTVPDTALVKPHTLTVGVNVGSAPLAGQSPSSARVVGVDVDIAAYLADQMGCKVSIVDVGNDPIAALEQGSVDVVLGVDLSEEDTSCWRSDPYLQTGVALFGMAAETAVPTVDSKPQIAAQASSKSSWGVTNLFGDDSLVPQDNLKNAFDVMRDGTVRYVAADAVIGAYMAHTNGFDCKIIALLQDPSGFCAAVSNSNAEMQQAVASGMSSLNSGGMIRVIQTKWFGEPFDLSGVTIVKSATANKDAKSSKKKSS